VTLILCNCTIFAATHPVLATEGAGMGLQAEFSWAGTKDYAPWLSTFAALEFYKRAGGESIRTHNHELAVWAGA
jgi:isopenicillin-N epimerase